MAWACYPGLEVGNGMAHVIYQPELAMEAGITAPIVVGGEEAHHAVRVKRLEVGAEVRLLNGRGLVLDAKISAVKKPRGEWEVVVAPTGPAVMAARTRPALRVIAGVPKGDRLEQMVDGLSQVGASLWAPLVSARMIVDPRDAKLERLKRVCEESLKQCGRAWMLEIGEKVEFAAAVGGAWGGKRSLVVADVSGEEFARSGAEEVTLLVGPEGGFSPDEVKTARAMGARVCSFGVHTMRVETAAVVAAAAIVRA